VENWVWGGARNDCLKDELNTIFLLRKIISSKRWIGRKPYRTRKMTMEEEVRVIFHYSTSYTMFVNVSGVPCCSFSYGKCPAY